MSKSIDNFSAIVLDVFVVCKDLLMILNAADVVEARSISVKNECSRPELSSHLSQRHEEPEKQRRQMHVL